MAYLLHRGYPIVLTRASLLLVRLPFRFSSTRPMRRSTLSIPRLGGVFQIRRAPPGALLRLTAVLGTLDSVPPHSSPWCWHLLTNKLPLLAQNCTALRLCLSRLEWMDFPEKSGLREQKKELGRPGLEPGTN